ncbi:MAG: DEAD/DEAH box helicase [Thermodesulfovibrionales bacterium]|nr:DEAD/DEAH box helicase [Thermodesulfovibrionales bacterium]
MKFKDFSLSEETIKALYEMGFEEPTPVQTLAIPLILKGRDIIGQAQTGTGKTAAFGIPIVERCKKGKNPFALILEPTRELALQVSQEIHNIGKYRKLRILPVYGGASLERQVRALKNGVNILVATPGRLIDHINRNTLSLSDIKIVVLDEADEMLNMGFIEDIETILKNITSEHQTLLFSATMPLPIINIAKRYMKNPEKVRINTEEIIVPEIRQIFYEVKEEDKLNALSRLLDVENPRLAMVFCHTKKEVDEISMKLNEMGYSAGALHGDHTQSKREAIIGKFKKGMLDILVATDVAARGLDIKDVTHVINYSIPQNPERYIHRIGRTGRAGQAGIAITFVTSREYRHLKLIEKSAKTVIDRKKLPTREEVIKARQKKIHKEIEEIIKYNKHLDYVSAVNQLSKLHSLEKIAAAALYFAYGETKPAQEKDEISGSNGMTRLFMTIGKKDRIKVADIVKSIASEAKIAPASIGNIDVLEKFSFVEVPEELAERVIHSVDDMVLKGRRIRIERAKLR